MLAAKSLIAAAVMALSLPTLAGTTLLDFESVSDITTAMTVSNPYSALGFNFSANAYSAASDKARVKPGDGSFYRDLKPDGKTDNRGALVLWDGKSGQGEGIFSFLINVADGFDTSVDLSYATGLFNGGQVEVFSDVDGAGSAVAGLALTATGSCENAGYICKWNDATIDLQGKVGRSIRFTGSNALLIFDDLKFQRNGQVPEPGGVALSLAALGALAWSRSKRRAA
jgi:hypothetical protein